MQYRITLSVALGLALILGIFAYLSMSAVEQSKDAAAQERLMWAKAAAFHIEDAVQRTLVQVERTAEQVAHEMEEGDYAHVEKHLEAFAGSLFTGNLAVFDTTGSPFWRHGPAARADTSTSLFQPIVRRVLREGKALFAACPEGPSAKAVSLCIAAPVRETNGSSYGVLAARLDPRIPELRLLLPPELGKGAHAELLTGEGKVIASDLAEDVGSTIHASVLEPFLTPRRPGVKVHKMPSDSPMKSHIVAYVPLSSLPWGMAVEQDQDVALAVASGLQRRFLYFGLLALVGAALLAWLDVRQVVKPLRMLTSRAARMAAGDLETPIGLARRDEVGMLARSFEKMRSQLKASLEELGRRDRELEERVRQRTREVERLYAELQAKEDLRSHLLEKLISAQEEERARIARELHDEAGQSLTGIVMSLEAAASLPPDAQPLRERLERAKALALDTIEEIRKLVVDLRPAALDDLGLAAALRAYAEERLAERGVKVDLETSELGQRLPPHVEGALFRVVQEAITNIARHADAKTARIRLRRDDQRLTLLVEDDGRGFDMAEVLGSPDKTRALGLLGMQERVALCGGSLRVESAPGRGTQVRAEIPLPEEAAPGGPARGLST